MKRLLETFGKTDIANILGVIIVIGSFVMLYLLICKEIPKENKDVVMTAVGFILGGALGGTVGYFYGGNKGLPKV